MLLEDARVSIHQAMISNGRPITPLEHAEICCRITGSSSPQRQAIIDLLQSKGAMVTPPPKHPGLFASTDFQDYWNYELRILND